MRVALSITPTDKQQRKAIAAHRRLPRGRCRPSFGVPRLRRAGAASDRKIAIAAEHAEAAEQRQRLAAKAAPGTAATPRPARVILPMSPAKL